MNDRPTFGDWIRGAFFVIDGMLHCTGYVVVGGLFCWLAYDFWVYG